MRSIYLLCLGLLGIRADPKKRSISNFAGIPVPGQTVNGVDIFNLYFRSCSVDAKPDDPFVATLKSLTNSGSEQSVKQIYANLFYNAGGVDADKINGRWFKVLDSPSVHNEACGVSYIKTHQNSAYSAVFSTKDFYRSNNSDGGIFTVNGRAMKYGPDAGEFFLFTGRVTDSCPCRSYCYNQRKKVLYLLIKTGPLDEEQMQYEYLIFSQFLKFPVMVYAKDYRNFEAYHKRDVKKFLELYNFLNSHTVTNNLIRFLNFDSCRDEYYYYLSINE